MGDTCGQLTSMLQLQAELLPYRDFLLNLLWERRRQVVVSAVTSWHTVPQVGARCHLSTGKLVPLPGLRRHQQHQEGHHHHPGGTHERVHQPQAGEMVWQGIVHHTAPLVRLNCPGNEAESGPIGHTHALPIVGMRNTGHCAAQLPLCGPSLCHVYYHRAATPVLLYICLLFGVQVQISVHSFVLRQRGDIL